MNLFLFPYQSQALTRVRTAGCTAALQSLVEGMAAASFCAWRVPPGRRARKFGISQEWGFEADECVVDEKIFSQIADITYMDIEQAAIEIVAKKAKSPAAVKQSGLLRLPSKLNQPYQSQCFIP